MKPSIGRIVHYVAYGTPNGEFKPAHRAAVVTEVFVPVPGDGETKIKVCVLNPTGIFFSDWMSEDETGQRGGSWHWPERE
ncbi:hypothetical protein [Deinococcus alpinitundrae]|uniref:hypothetical protein n=1 Tax=Deinococcus alpinitundrae TaxID=468913 RepID=UPI00137AD76A|nr:hypothetical protein [Deinococcus alpinitundrae]